MKEHNIQLLDCTLRDGGLGLEDAYINGLSKVEFETDDIDIIINHLRDAKIDIIELGSIQITSDDRRGFAIYQSIEELSKKIPQNRKPNQLFVGLYRGPDTPIEDIPDHTPSMVAGVRVIIRYSELQKSLDFCAALSKKGYKVFVQPMLTMRYTKEEIDLIIRESNAMKAYAVYFVDSYGYMQKDDVLHYLKRYDEGLADNIRIGFHAHNNMNLAYANTIEFLNFDSKHDLICDSCAIGMGQGAGNLQTELILPHLNRFYNRDYDFSKMLEVCEIIEKYHGSDAWGYSVTRLLPALHKTAYKYAVRFRNHYGLKYSEIEDILSNMPNEWRHRYTSETAEKLMNLRR